MQKVSSVTFENFDSGFDDQVKLNVVELDNFCSDVASYGRDEARGTAAFIDKTGNLRRSIKKRKSKFENGGYIVVASGKNADKGYHAHLVEFGHVKVLWGNRTGERVPALPFMRPALEKAIAYAASKIGSGK